MEQPTATAVNLANLGGGAAIERFDHELSKIIANIKDVNTDPKKNRSITLKVTFMPHGDRTGMSTVVDCTSKLASVPPVAVGAMFILRNEGGDLQAYSHDIRQGEIFTEPEEEEAPAPNVVPMSKKA